MSLSCLLWVPGFIVQDLCPRFFYTWFSKGCETVSILYENHACNFSETNKNPDILTNSDGHGCKGKEEKTQGKCGTEIARKISLYAFCMFSLKPGNMIFIKK